MLRFGFEFAFSGQQAGRIVGDYGVNTEIFGALDPDRVIGGPNGYREPVGFGFANGFWRGQRIVQGDLIRFQLKRFGYQSVARFYQVHDLRREQYGDMSLR